MSGEPARLKRRVARTFCILVVQRIHTAVPATIAEFAISCTFFCVQDLLNRLNSSGLVKMANEEEEPAAVTALPVNVIDFNDLEGGQVGGACAVVMPAVASCVRTREK